MITLGTGIGGGLILGGMLYRGWIGAAFVGFEALDAAGVSAVGR